MGPRTPAFGPLLAAAVLLPLAAAALTVSGRGNGPVHDAGWPEGAHAVANLETRVGWREGPPEGGGEWQFQYRGDTAAFAQGLTAFAAIRAPALELVLHDGPQEGALLQDPDHPQLEARVDWTFTVWHPASWHRLFNDPRSVFEADHPNFRRPVDPPRLDVYIGGGGTVDWAKVTVPSGVRVRDERAAAAGVNPVGGAVVRADFYDMATGKPVRGARLVAEHVAPGGGDTWKRYEVVGEALSDAAGRVQIEKLPAGSIRLSVSAPGYAGRGLGQERYGDLTFRQYQVELAGQASVTGVVQDAESQPLAGAKVRAANSMAIDGRGYPGPAPVEATTDATGRFELAGLAVGYTQLRVRAPDYTSGDATIHAVPAKDVVIRVGRTGRIAVSVVDAQGKALSRFEGNPVLVEVEPKGGAKVGTWGGGAQVKEDGTFEFTGVWPGEYRVWAHPNPSSTNRQYAPDQFVRVEPGGKAEVRFVLGGSPVPTAKLEFRAADDQPGPGLTEMAAPGSERKVHVASEVLLANDAVRSAAARRGDGAVWQIEVVFTEAGAARFAEITDACIGRPLAVLVDGKLISAPVVRERIEGGMAVLTGAFTEAEARRIAAGLAGGR